jgi:hypothetical protein
MRGSLLFVDVIKTSPFTLGLQALNLAALIVSPVVVLGPGGSFYDQVSAISSDGLTYYATIQQEGEPIKPFLPSAACEPKCATGSQCCVDPSPNSTAACFAVDDCSKINQGHRYHGETIAVALSTTADGGAAGSIKARMNTSMCFKLAAVGPDELLCLYGSETGNISVNRIDLKAKTTTLVGSFDKSCDGTYNEAAAYDPTSGIFYAYLGQSSMARARRRARSTALAPRRDDADARRRSPASGEDGCPEGLHALDTKTGTSLPPMSWDPSLLVADFEIDPATGEAYAAVEHKDSPPPNVAWSKGLVTLNLTSTSSPTVPWAPISTDVFGKQEGSKCVKGTSPGAAKHCYYQLNNAAYAEGTFFLNAFETPASAETVIATEATTGKVLFEHAPIKKGNVVDMAYTKWEAPAH